MIDETDDDSEEPPPGPFSRAQNHMQSHAGKWPSVEKPFVGLPCAVKWSKDGVWYRAVVVRILDDPAKLKVWTVQFSFYGDYETLNLSMTPSPTADLPSISEHSILGGAVCGLR